MSNFNEWGEWEFSNMESKLYEITDLLKEIISLLKENKKNE